MNNDDHRMSQEALDRLIESFDDFVLAYTLILSDMTAEEVRGTGVVNKEQEDAYEEWINSFSGLNGREGIGKKATPIGEAVNFTEVKK